MPPGRRSSTFGRRSSIKLERRSVTKFNNALFKYFQEEQEYDSVKNLPKSSSPNGSPLMPSGKSSENSTEKMESPKSDSNDWKMELIEGGMTDNQESDRGSKEVEDTNRVLKTIYNSTGGMNKEQMERVFDKDTLDEYGSGLKKVMDALPEILQTATKANALEAVFSQTELSKIHDFLDGNLLKDEETMKQLDRMLTKLLEYFCDRKLKVSEDLQKLMDLKVKKVSKEEESVLNMTELAAQLPHQESVSEEKDGTLPDDKVKDESIDSKRTDDSLSLDSILPDVRARRSEDSLGPRSDPLNGISFTESSDTSESADYSDDDYHQDYHQEEEVAQTQGTVDAVMRRRGDQVHIELGIGLNLAAGEVRGAYGADVRRSARRRAGTQKVEKVKKEKKCQKCHVTYAKPSYLRSHELQCEGVPTLQKQAKLAAEKKRKATSS